MKFHVVHTAERSQSAIMILDPGESSGPKENEHAGSEQVLYLAEGRLQAEIGERRLTLAAGDSIIVKRGEPHRFTNTGSEPAVTFNVYAPPAY